MPLSPTCNFLILWLACRSCHRVLCQLLRPRQLCNRNAWLDYVRAHVVYIRLQFAVTDFIMWTNCLHAHAHAGWASCCVWNTFAHGCGCIPTTAGLWHMALILVYGAVKTLYMQELQNAAAPATMTPTVDSNANLAQKDWISIHVCVQNFIRPSCSLRYISRMFSNKHAYIYI